MKNKQIKKEIKILEIETFKSKEKDKDLRGSKLTQEVNRQRKYEQKKKYDWK